MEGRKGREKHVGVAKEKRKRKGRRRRMKQELTGGKDTKEPNVLDLGSWKKRRPFKRHTVAPRARRT